MAPAKSGNNCTYTGERSSIFVGNTTEQIVPLKATIREGRLRATDAHQFLATYTWYPNGVSVDGNGKLQSFDGIRGIVFFFHGLHGYSCNANNHVMNHMTQNGIICHGMDYKGHGHSEGLRGYFPSIGSLVNDYLSYIRTTCETYDCRLPYFLLGESIGGAVSIKTAREIWNAAQGTAAQRWQQTYIGSIMIAPAIQLPDGINPVLMAMSKALSKLTPSLEVAKLEDGGSMCNDPVLDQYWQTDSVNWRGGIRARVGRTLLDAQIEIMDNISTFSFPYLILHGECDTTCPPSGSQRFHTGCSSQNKTLIMHPGMKHDLLRDYGFEKVIVDISKWIDEMLSARKIY